MLRRDLDPAAEMIPRRLEWLSTSRRSRSIPTDVLELPGRFTHAAGPIAGPGDLIIAPSEPGGDPPRATIGIALDHPEYGSIVTTAGHLLFDQGQVGTVVYPQGTQPRVALAGQYGEQPYSTGVALKTVVNDRADYTLVRPDGEVPRGNVFRDSIEIVDVHWPSPGDLLGRRLSVLGAAGVRSAGFLGYRGVIQAGNAGLMHDMIITDFVTADGDSGACLIDDEFRAWGLLVGYSVHQGSFYSAFTSALVPLIREGARFL